jgi:Xaa-Pro aminopeptidase
MKNAYTPSDILLKIVKEKHKMIPDIMEREQIDCWITFIRETAANPDPVQNLIIAGEVVWESAFIFVQKNDDFKKIAIVGNFDADHEKGKGLWDEVIPYKEGISNVLKETIDTINPNKIALNYSLDDVMSDGLSHGLFLRLKLILDSYEDRFCEASKIIQTLRSKKSPSEIELITNSALLTEKLNQEITEFIKPGLKEIEIQKFVHNRMDEEGVLEAWQRTGCPSIDAGPDKVLGHTGPSELLTKSGHTMHNDFGVKLHGYCSDIQRMWFFGNETEIPEELQKAFDTVKGAIQASAKIIKPGKKGYEVDQVARDYVVTQGYEEYAHALGHQVGTQAHDGGVLLGPLWERYGELPKGDVEAGNVFTLELYVKTENYGMVSLEEMILVTDNGCKFIVPPQEKFITINS